MDNSENELMITISFAGLNKNIPLREIDKELLEVDFNGAMKVKFQKNKSGFWRPVNAMDGWGHNCFDQVKNDKPTLKAFP